MVSVAAFLIKIPQCFSNTFCLYLVDVKKVVIEMPVFCSSGWPNLPGVCVSRTRSPGPLTTCWTRTPSDYDDFSAIQRQSLTYARLYAYHAIKGNLSNVCRPLSQWSNLPVLRQRSASFAPVTDLRWFVVPLPRTHQRSTVYLQKPFTRRACVRPHSPRKRGKSLAPSQTLIPQSQRARSGVAKKGATP